MKNTNFKQLVIVCRNYAIDWAQFINPFYVGVETGTLSLLKDNKVISFVCGDNDTLSKKNVKLIMEKSKKLGFEFIAFPPEKDFIDSELAIVTAIKRNINFQQVVLIADGKRWDMLLANINILKKYEQFNPLLIGKNNYCFILQAPIEHIFTDFELSYHYISIFTFDNNKVIYNFSGCKYYPEQDIEVTAHSTQTISNQFIKKAKFFQPKINIKQGKCLIFLHKK